jgi:hypothetical protein
MTDNEALTNRNQTNIFYFHDNFSLLLPPGVNFTNILKAHLPLSLTFTETTKKLRAKLSYKKAARKMLVKLTPA